MSQDKSFLADQKTVGHDVAVFVGEIPEHWQEVAGNRSRGDEYRSEYSTWTLLRVTTSEAVTWEAVSAELGLVTLPHPNGILWLAGDQPVAFSGKSGCDDNCIILGDVEFFHSRGFAILAEERFSAHSALCWKKNVRTTCSRILIRKEQSIQNLQPAGWYPLEVTPEMVVWGTGLALNPKDLVWKVDSDRPQGVEVYGDSGPTLDPRGTKIFDSSNNRLDRVREFFREQVGLSVNDPRTQYVLWANATDPRRGVWRNRHQYPNGWLPPFDGWGIEKFPGLECRWKQPEEGPARYYGVILKAPKNK